MGAAFTIPCLENNNNVVITEPYSDKFTKDLKSRNKFHSGLKMKLPKKLKYQKFGKELFQENYQLIVIALSLPGVDLIVKELEKFKNKIPILVLTKGLKYDKKKRKF